MPRYLYDAEHIVEAYRNLWDENTKPVAQLLAEIEDNGVYEVEDIWKDPLYLHDLAISLMGPSASGLLQEGFRLRDRTMFENGVKELDSQARNVRKAGLLLTLAGYIFFAEPEDRMDAMLASHKDRKRMLDNYEKLGEMAATIALYRLPRDRESLRACGPCSCMRRACTRTRWESSWVSPTSRTGKAKPPLRSWGERRFSAYWT